MSQFPSLLEDRPKRSEQPRIRDKWTRLAKLESMVLGERNLGQQVLEIVISGCDKPEEAEAALRCDFEAIIRIERGVEA